MEHLSAWFQVLWVELCALKKIGWSPNPQYLRMWLYLEIESLQIYLGYNEIIRVIPNPIWLVSFFIFFFKLWVYLFIYLFIYLWLCWVLVSVRGLPLVAVSGGHSSSQCAGLSLSRRLLLRSTGSRRAGSVVVADGPSCSAACGIFPDQGSIPCPLHWQADSQPLRHQGSPIDLFFMTIL